MGTVTYARHIYARAIASFEHFMMDSREVSFIVHLLFNVQAGVLQPAAGSLSAKSVIVTITIVRAVTSITVRAIIVVLETGLRSVCSDHRHSRLELGGVYPIRSERAPTPYQASYAMMRFLSAWCLSVLPKLQPPLFLIRQHISPHALFMQPRPCTPSRPPTRRRRPTPT